MAETKRRQVIRRRSVHHRVVYANNIAMTFTGQDVRIRFGIVEEGTPEVLNIEDQVDVLLSPVEFAKLHQTITRNLGMFNVTFEHVPAAPQTNQAEPKLDAPKPGS